jgi:hypothetical protein
MKAAEGGKRVLLVADRKEGRIKCGAALPSPDPMPRLSNVPCIPAKALGREAENDAMMGSD